MTKKKDAVETVYASRSSEANIGLDWGVPITISELRRRMSPSSVHDQILRAQQYRKEVAIIGQIIDTKIDFGSAGFKTYHTKKDVKKYYDDTFKKWQFDNIVSNLFDDYLTTSNMFLVWNVERGSLKWVMVADPSTIEIKRGFGGDMLWLKLDDDFIQMVNNPQKYFVGLSNSEIQDQLDKIPVKYQEAAKNRIDQNAGRVLLKNADGDYWCIGNRGRVGDVGLVRPSMTRIFEEIEQMKMFKDGRWSVLYLAKHLITLIKAGEKRAKDEPQYPIKKAIELLKTEFKRKGKSAEMYGDWTTTIEFLSPKLDILNPEHYLSLENEILSWGGVSRALIRGEGGTYAGSWLNMSRKIYAEMRAIQKMIARMLEVFMETIRHGDMGIKDKVPDIVFDTQGYKEFRQLLDETKFLQGEGNISKRTAMETFGYSSRIEKERKADEWEDRQVFAPTYETKQGLGIPLVFTEEKEQNLKVRKDIGRPSEGDGQDLQRPRPSTASIKNIDYASKFDLETERDNWETVSADFKTDNFYHIESPETEWENNDILGSRKLDNGVVLRFGKLKSGRSEVKIVLIPTSMVRDMVKAKFMAKRYF